MTRKKSVIQLDVCDNNNNNSIESHAHRMSASSQYNLNRAKLCKSREQQQESNFPEFLFGPHQFVECSSYRYLYAIRAIEAMGGRNSK